MVTTKSKATTGVDADVMAAIAAARALVAPAVPKGNGKSKSKKAAKSAVVGTPAAPLYVSKYTQAEKDAMKARRAERRQRKVKYVSAIMFADAQKLFASDMSAANLAIMEFVATYTGS